MGRGRVVVRYNHLPKVMRALPRETKRGVDESVREFTVILKRVVWSRSGVIKSTIEDIDPRPLHATISIGINLGRGFYSRFNEWGTVKQAARPVVGPAAHQFEPVFVDIMADHLRKACDAR